MSEQHDEHVVAWAIYILSSLVVQPGCFVRAIGETDAELRARIKVGLEDDHE